MIIVTTPERLDSIEATNDNTLDAVESAARVPTTGTPIAADGDGPAASAPCTVDATRALVNATRRLTYVSLTSGLIVHHLSSNTHPPVQYDSSTDAPDKLDRVRRTMVLACDPWQSPEQQRATAEACALTIVAADAARYAPVSLLAALLEMLDRERLGRAHAETRSAN